MPLLARGLLILALTSSCAVVPDPAPHAVAQPSPAREDHHAEGAEGHGKGTQALNGFFGGSAEIGDLDGLTFGLDYEYRLSHKWGVGGFVEAVSGLGRSFAFGAQAYWHVVGELVLVAGPGLERHGDSWEPIARVGAFHEFPLGGGWVLSPGVFYDLTPGEDLLIYGINLGYIWH
jgi:hypothetical protein